MIPQDVVWSMVNKPFNESLLSPTWKEYSQRFYNMMFPKIPDNFLQYPICVSVFAGHGSKWIPDIVKYLEGEYTEARMKETLKDPDIGQPSISVPKYGASESTLMALNHVTRYGDATGKEFDPDVVMEIGGGYGNMARMFGNHRTWILVDIPVVSVLQYHYLSQTSDVVLKVSGEIEKGRINVVSLACLDDVYIPHVDTMVSTFALNECGEQMGNMLRDRIWYGAENFLLAHWGHYNIDLIKTAFNVTKPDEDIGGGCPASYTFI